MPRMMSSSGLACGEAPSSSIGPAPPADAELLSAAATWQPRNITFNNRRNHATGTLKLKFKVEAFATLMLQSALRPPLNHEHNVINFKFMT